MSLNLLASLFKKKHISADLSFIVADIHSHLIPGIDDGAKNMEDAIQMIQGLYDLGIKKIYTTPHIMGDTYRNTSEIINEGLLDVNNVLKEKKISPPIHATSEYYFDENFFKLIEKKDLLTFGDNYLLFELPHFNRPANIEEIVFQLNLAGYKPILAHPERYPYLYDAKLSQYEKLKNIGLCFQVNLLSFIGGYTADAKFFANKLAELKMINFIATDLHNQAQLNFIKNKLSQKIVDKIITNNLLNEQLL